MRKFETLLLLSPELAADAREALLGTFTGVIERAGGRFTAVLKAHLLLFRKKVNGQNVKKLKTSLV